ncbi:NACHT domain-containing protein [Actinopolymorpha cephalotaxi]|nr:NACHT domain-containing protein [Actinopolymorpha cephalotaxi]
MVAARQVGRTPKPDYLNVEDVAIAVRDASGEIVGLLGSNHMQIFVKFLKSPEVQGLIRSYFLCQLAEKDGYPVTEIREDLNRAFCQLAKHHSDDADPWHSMAPDVWDRLTNFVDEVLPVAEIVDDGSQDDLDDLRNLVDGAHVSGELRTTPPRYLREVADISGDLTRLLTISQHISDIRLQLRDHYSQMRLEHAQEDHRYEMADLYIERTLLSERTGRDVDSSQLLQPERRLRWIVTGDPGVGKSTFTEHAIRTICSRPELDIVAPLVIRGREYASSGYLPLIDELRRVLSKRFNLRLSTASVEDILVMGRGIFVVDGIDEVLDLGLRRDLIREIESFSRQYPLCTVLATSRNVGYGQARFDHKFFDRYHLKAFTDEQVQDYSERWFKLVGRPKSDLTKFISELESIPDLRANPLMLSLLCILFRARGYIPRNRRQVYAACADLLFRRWDSMRHIAQPYDHEHYGETLMQEIAGWFYKSRSAQSGVEERQIEKVISTFFVDTAGVLPTEAQKRARDFLEFCAGRAWLLAVSGTNDRNQRLFVFTHRTFMEFFAAESFVRETQSIDQIIDRVAEVYRQDASSVLPDLIVQSAEAHRSHGARDIIEGLLERKSTKVADPFLPLCLRIINISPVNAVITEKLFRRTLDQWQQFGPDLFLPTFVAILELYRDPRQRFINLLTSDVEELQEEGVEGSEILSRPATQFLQRWARVYLSEGAVNYQEEWGTFVAEIAEVVADYVSEIDDMALIHYLVEAGLCTWMDDRPLTLTTRAFGHPVAGATLRSFERLLLGNQPTEYDARHLLGVAEYLHGAAGDVVTEEFASELNSVLRDRVTSWPHRGGAGVLETEMEPAVSSLGLWMGFVTYEYSTSVGPYHEACSDLLGVELLSLCVTRGYLLGDHAGDPEQLTDGNIRVLSLTECRAELAGPRDYPHWYVRWARGAVQLVESEDDDEDD